MTSGQPVSAEPVTSGHKPHPPALWNKARVLYITGEANIPRISELLGIPVETLYTRLRKEHWGRKRREYLASLPELPTTPTQPQPAEAQPEPNDFQARRLLRVREQLERLDAMMATETDATKLDRLASATTRLEEQERRLSGRSLPPVLKAQAKGKPKSGSPAPLD